MGNRAVITTEEAMRNDGLGVYLHWNGGRDSVEAFLEYCRLRGFRSPEGSYGMARLCQVIANFLGGGLSIGIDNLWHLDLDNGDNGVYVIDGSWKIVKRLYHTGPEQNSYDLAGMLVEIDKKQPAEDQLGEDYLRADVTKTADLKIGDKAWVDIYGGRPELWEILGVGDLGRVVNGQDVSLIPYVGMFQTPEGPASNINNYLLRDSYRVKW